MNTVKETTFEEGTIIGLPSTTSYEFGIFEQLVGVLVFAAFLYKGVLLYKAKRK